MKYCQINMFDLFSRKSKKLLGIDIGTKHIKIVELEKTEKGLVLKNYAFADLGQGNARQMQNQETANILKQMLEQAKIETKETAMSLPAFSTFLAVVDLPGMSEQATEESIKFEAKKYIPIPLEEVTLGWHKLNKDQVLLIAVPKNLSNKYGEIAKIADLHLQSLEAETFSLARVLAAKEKDPVIIIDLGARSINISLIENGLVKTNRTIENKQDIEQIKQVLKLKASKIILTGGGTDSSISQKIRSELKKLKLPISTGNPWTHITYNPKLEKALKELGPYLTVAVGLAMRVYV